MDLDYETKSIESARAIQKVTSTELLTEQTVGNKMLLYTKRCTDLSYY
jgi:hypothetical protein